MSQVYYVNLTSGRIVLDPKSIEAPETLKDYVIMNESSYHDYCIEQRRKLDASKLKHKEEEEAFEQAEDERIDRLSTQISTTLGISKEDAKTMVPRQHFTGTPDFSVSEKVFGDIVLPEEEG